MDHSFLSFIALAIAKLFKLFCYQCHNCYWVGDISFVATEEGWLYLATVIDLFSRKIVAGQWIVI
ncbi:MAG: hypothetical protein EKK61_04750 [Rickettsiales bacterium]|nr:MAG: hypothetical protein EKK61_04750 [Rickettsiales bacterium]